MNFDSRTLALAEKVLDACRSKDILLSTAESCTGGLVVGALTEIAGSSDVVDRGFVTYTNRAKSTMLGIPAGLIENHGAVSEQVAKAMAEGAIRNSSAGIAAAVTGIAGPGGATAQKPVGLVHFAVSCGAGATIHVERKFGKLSRGEIRTGSVNQALEMILETVIR